MSGQQQETIVLIDDEPRILASMRLVLELEGYAQIRSYLSYDLARIDLDSGIGSLLILDINMPGTDGYAALQEIQSKRPGFPVIVSTANDRVRLAVDCMKQGAIDFLVKPVDSECLLAAVQQGLGAAAKDIPTTSGPASQVLSELESRLQGKLDTKVYTQPDLTLDGLAKQLDTNRTYLARVIAQRFQSSYRVLITQLRVEEFLRLSQGNRGRYTLEALGREAGFASRSAFYDAVRKATGKTPADWVAPA
ncbi:MAG: hypothetical protein RL318_1802 [Fibrobacterota bacterium]|jgi:DNA-binding NtrC family response regulator